MRELTVGGGGPIPRWLCIGSLLILIHCIIGGIQCGGIATLFQLHLDLPTLCTRACNCTHVLAL